MHAQKQCISPNENDGMKYRDKMYCFQVVETEPFKHFFFGYFKVISNFT